MIVSPPYGCNHVSLPQIRRQRELPRTSEVCPYIVKDLILRTSEVFFFLGVRATFGVVSVAYKV